MISLVAVRELSVSYNAEETFTLIFARSRIPQTPTYSVHDSPALKPSQCQQLVLNSNTAVSIRLAVTILFSELHMDMSSSLSIYNTGYTPT
jgi:hypothetical protein